MPVDVEGVTGPRDPSTSAASELADMLGDPDLGDLQGETRIRKRPNKRFFLRHFPTDWIFAEVDGSPVVLPDLAPHVLLPGTNGVRTRDREEDDSASYRDAVDAAQKEGWTYIPWSHVITDPAHLPSGVAPGKYIRTIACRDGLTKAEGTFYVEAWNVPVPTPRGQDQLFRFDRTSYHRWLASIVRSAPGANDGLIDPPMQSVLEQLRRRYADRVGRIKARPNPDPQDRAQKVKAAEVLATRADLAEAPRKPAKAAGGKR
jgi:hypothetical protein